MVCSNSPFADENNSPTQTTIWREFVQDQSEDWIFVSQAQCVAQSWQCHGFVFSLFEKD